MQNIKVKIVNYLGSFDHQQFTKKVNCLFCNSTLSVKTILYSHLENCKVLRDHENREEILLCFNYEKKQGKLKIQNLVLNGKYKDKNYQLVKSIVEFIGYFYKKINYGKKRKIFQVRLFNGTETFVSTTCIRENDRAQYEQSLKCKNQIECPDNLTDYIQMRNQKEEEEEEDEEEEEIVQFQVEKEKEKEKIQVKKNKILFFIFIFF